MVAGMMQIQFMVPDDAWVSPFDPLVLTVGNYSSPDGVWMVVVQ